VRGGIGRVLLKNFIASLAALGLVLLVAVPSASAQSCTTLTLSSSYSTTHCSDGASGTAYCSGSICLTTANPATPPPPAPVYVPPTVYAPTPNPPNPPLPVVTAVPPAPGLDISLGGVPTHLPQVAFVKADDSPAIYVVWNQTLLAFPDWATYIGCGGSPDLSGVWRVVHVANGLIVGSLPSRGCGK
jgi:hypothetical protein